VGDRPVVAQREDDLQAAVVADLILRERDMRQRLALDERLLQRLDAAVASDLVRREVDLYDRIGLRNQLRDTGKDPVAQVVRGQQIEWIVPPDFRVSRITEKSLSSSL
jgi:hypothetical protein